MPQSERTALVVSAHAADFVWRAGGAIALHARHGWRVALVCLSFGERGESAKLWREEGITLETVKAARRREAEEAARILGAAETHFFDIGDYPLNIDRATLDRLVDVFRAVQPEFVLTHSADDPYNTDHPATTRLVMEARMVAQAWGHNPGQKVLGAPQVYLFEPHQTEQCGWTPDVLLDISEVWDLKRKAIETMAGQEHLWSYYTNVAEQRANQARRNSGGQAGSRPVKQAEAFQSIFPRVVADLA